MASPPTSRIAGAPAEQLLLPDEILEDIFLRMDSGYDLARASATCRDFRRVATARPFLRRFLSLHPPPIVGFVLPIYRGLGLFQAEPPHRSARAARAVAQSGDFTFSFLPSASHPNSSWWTHDARDGRFLLSRRGTVATTFLELVVCDPLYRRHVQIPPIPGDIVPRTPRSNELKSEAFLAPADGVESEEDSHFRVIYNWLSDYKVVTFVFSSATGKWFYATSFSFLPARLILYPKKCVRYYARNCFFWMYHRGGKYMLKFDPREMKFVILELLHYTIGCPQRAIIDAADDRLGLIHLDHLKLDLYSRTFQNNGLGEEDWRRDNSISLPVGYSYYIIIASEGYLLLRGLPLPIPSSLVGQQLQCFVVDLKTFLVERLCRLPELDVLSNYFDARPYASFPPPLSLPSL